MKGVLLDSISGRPQTTAGLTNVLSPSGVPFSVEENMRRGWTYGRGHSLTDALTRAPASVKALLDKARAERDERFVRTLAGERVVPAMGAAQFWEMVEYATVSDGAQVLNTTTETIMVPDFTLPANYLYPGRVLKYTVLGNVSTVITTPGTVTVRLRYGGVAGTALAATGAFAPDPTAASTTVSVAFEWYVVCRTVGSSGTVMCMGRATWNDYDDASATALKDNLNMSMIPTSAPATATINTTAANALSPTITFSVSTATTQFTANIAILESLT